MTTALKAMVEAMISEAARQDIAEAESAARQPWLADEPVTAEHQYDWAKVARAGLAAIRPNLGPIKQEKFDDPGHVALTMAFAYIEAILQDQP